MTTDHLFHMDANGVRISADRAKFGQHTYATRNISGLSSVTDRGNRIPGRITLVIGFTLIVTGFVIAHTITMAFGAVAILSGSLNLARKRPKFGLRITTQRGPVNVLAAADKRYVETVSKALLKAMSTAREASALRRQGSEARGSDPGGSSADGGPADPSGTVPGARANPAASRRRGRRRRG